MGRRPITEQFSAGPPRVEGFLQERARGNWRCHGTLAPDFRA
jgi:hypothetical protein